MWRVMLGAMLGVYLAQTYDLPNVREKFHNLNKYIKDNKLLDEKDRE